ncbi:MAG TPA: protein kinase [Candidatus Angelobacter sp.]|nr:protein kinase [Candidatus Angelobacter sp.]
MGGKQPQASVLAKPHHSLPAPTGFFAPSLVTVLSLPLGFLFALGFQGNTLTYAITVVSFGLLTALDLKTGFLRSILGFGATLLTLSYILQNSTFASQISTSAGFSFLFVALPPAAGVFLSTILFSKKERYRVPKQMILATLATGVGLIVGASKATGTNLIGSSLFSASLFIGLGLAANSLQMGLLFFLDKFWQTKRFSMAVMPPAFFSYNAIVGYLYFTTFNPDLAYIFFSSLGFLPILAVAGIIASSIAVRMLGSPTQPKTPSAPTKAAIPSVAPPRIRVSGDHSIKLGHVETIKIATESEGKPRDMATIDASIQTPVGKRDQLRLSHVSVGRYNAAYAPGKPGNYNANIVATSKTHQTSKETFSFTVQPQPIVHQPPPPAPRPAPQVSHPPSVSRPALPVPAQRPSPPPVVSLPPPPSAPLPKTGLPSLEKWDPRVWVNQEIHGYRVIEHVATGATGYVLRATFGQAATEMALKIPILKMTSRVRAVNEPTAGTITLNETMSEATRLLELSGQSKYVVQIRGVLVDRLNVQEIVKGNTALYYRSPPAIVMDFLKGGTAKKLIEDPQYEPLYYSEKWGGIVVMLGQMMAQALDMIHKAGFVHLDVKPQNVLFTSKPPLTGQDMLDQMVAGSLVPKLADLGSAVKSEGKVVQFTSEYAPGEQVLGDDADPSMDVYALGATLYTMLTRTPVHSNTLIEAMNNLSNNPSSGKAANDLESAWDSFSPDLSKIDPKFSAIIPVLKDMLNRDPARRPDAEKVASSLQRLVDKHGRLG